MLQRCRPKKGANAAAREERLLLGRNGMTADTSEEITRTDSPAKRSPAHRGEMYGWGPQSHGEERPRQTAGVGLPAFHSREPMTKTPVLDGPNPNSSLTSSSSAKSCTTSDFRLVEQELKELLSGCHRLFNSACDHNESKEETTVGPVTAEPTASRLSSPKPGILATSPLAEVAPKVGSGGIAKPNGDGGEAQDVHHVLHSATSPPISSVRGDRSTDSTPTPCLQLQQETISTRSVLEESENAVCIGTSYDSNPSTRVESPVDLFADALTEDQLSRSLEMQLQREQLMQMLQLHLEPSVVLHQTISSNLNTTMPLISIPTVDDGIGHPAVQRGANYPSPSFINRDSGGFDDIRDMVKACHRLYDSRVYTAYRYEECAVPHSRPMTADVKGSKASTDKVELGDLQSNSCLQRSAQCDAEVGVVQLPQGEHTSLDRRVTHVNGKAMAQLQRQRATSRRRREVVNSTTPEIATSARHTENPSMRSGATGGKRGPIVGATAGAEVFQHLSGNVKHASIGQRWDATVTGGGPWNGSSERAAVMATCPEADAGVTVTNGIDRGNQEHSLKQLKKQQQQQKQQSWSRCRYRRDYKTHGEYSLNRHVSAATRFHDMVERYVAAFEGGGDSTYSLPAFADSLVGAAISDFCPAVKRRQAQLKESQYAEARGASLARHTYRGSVGTIITTSGTAATTNPNVRSSWDSHGHRHYHPNFRTPQAVECHEPAAGATRMQHRPLQRRELP
ncbi:hypothetical protein TraAM80_05850 [Trypanosoma rangeli]|uniref:Uncharacterized protein n=1 Tax=Trypanosoma rangeli TaxID=5698 RepID=A0A3R7NAK9_TRYRA|nr:uncharacterized protein TraAM80_05850 [Trypanosoma rangeli]RNF03287.1 hypothetical protein TraAM80_05850 [Trypanosoma rangeli]|eukprot:RNF03287.1 hypothetical protein TraAM80_05850 [Trypanosoma rangeli]